jgi:phospholipid N-methyltransferase
VQYTYHFIRKPPAAVRRFQLHASQMVWLNLPPACVRVYRKT